MSFDTVTFWLFFAAGLVLWWRLPFAWAKTSALLFSLLFYAWWSPWYLPLIVTSAVVDFLAGARIARSTREGARRGWLLLSLGTNLGLLATFKYGGFALRNAGAISEALGLGPIGTAVPWVVPVGISFYTFQTLSYTIDVYRGRLAPAATFRDFFLFVAFFPQLVAGPIVRAQQLLPQLERRQRPTPWRVQHGLYLIVWGLFTKVVLADNLAPEVDRIFSAGPRGGVTPAEMWLGVVYSGTQVFADFAGYSAIAIGLASLLGLRFPKNFDYPYLSRSPSEFWVRWHITLSTWLRDYLYLPLGGNRKGATRTYVNAMLTMTIAGLWHGAAWSLVAWGAYHGVGVCVERALRRGKQPRSWPHDAPRGAVQFARRVACILACNVFIHTSWTFFRAGDMPTTGKLLHRLFVAPFQEGLGASVLLDARHLLLCAPVFAMHLVHAIREWYGWRERPWHRAVAAASMLAALVVVQRQNAMDFFYFQF